MNILEWIKIKLSKPVSYRVVIHAQAPMGNSVILYEKTVTAKSEHDALWSAVFDDYDRHNKKTKGYKWKWCAIEVKSSNGRAMHTFCHLD